MGFTEQNNRLSIHAWYELHHFHHVNGMVLTWYSRVFFSLSALGTLSAVDFFTKGGEILRTYQAVFHSPSTSSSCMSFQGFISEAWD